MQPLLVPCEKVYSGAKTKIMKTKIQLANISHIEEIAPLFDAYRVFYHKPSDIEGAKQFISDRIKNDESVIFIAYLNDKAVGFTQLYPIFSSTRMKRMWLLNDLYVNTEVRKTGLGKLLLEAAQNHCKNTNGCSVILETEKSNIIGNHLYPKMGFELDNDHNYYSWDI